MRQKLEFLSEDLAPITEPDEAALARRLAEHADAYRVEARVALRQVFVSRERRGDSAVADSQALLTRLAADPGADVAGDASLLPEELPLGPLGDVARVFGDAFAEQVAKLEPGRWSGPVESGFGLHLVLVEAREEARASALDEVREAVRNDWLAAQRAEANEAFFRRLRERYEVTVDAFAGPADAAPPAAAEAKP
jgi:parvulin-like peptidyl-prolyl isomerase